MPVDRSHEIAWAAGFFDGEGSIGIYATGKTGYQYRLSVQVSQKGNTDSLEKFKELFGGQISCQDKSQNYWRWMVYSRQAGNMLEIILPYLVVKKKQAEVALSFQGRRLKSGGIHLNLELHRKLDQEDYLLLRSLKKVGG